MKRRSVLRTASVGLSAVAGCFGDFPRYRRLGFDSVSVERGSGEYEISVVVVVEANPEERPWGVYHDVTLLARMGGGKRICSITLGDVAIGTRHTMLPCDRIPAELAFDAAESACDENTEFEKAVRVDSQSDEATWRLVDDECSK